MTLTRVFLLTHDHQSLVREITTPSLSSFITAALNAAAPLMSSQNPQVTVGESPLLLVVLQAFCELIVLHPNSFRPFAQQIQRLVLPLIAPAPSNVGSEGAINSITQSVTQASQRLFVLLSVCAPKNAAAEDWSGSLHNVILSAQRTTDRLFRGVIEEWRPRAEKSDLADLAIDEVICDRGPQPLALPGWIGVYAGIERLNGLLGALQAFLSYRTSMAVTLPASKIVSLADRILSVVQSGSASGLRMRSDITRDEREGLDVALPQLHESTIQVLSSLMSRMGSAYASILQSTVDQVLWVLDNQYTSDKVRKASYVFLSQVLSRWGPTLPYSCAKSVSRCARLCCEDLLPESRTPVGEIQPSASKGMKQSNGHPSSTSSDSYLSASPKTVTTSATSINVKVAAEVLLPLTLTNLRQGYLSAVVRDAVDRTAILTENRTAMVASVMNPSIKTKGSQPATSILPMLARAHNGHLECEALLRPQMPLMPMQNGSSGETLTDEEEEAGQQEAIANAFSSRIPEQASEYDANPNQLPGEGEQGNVDGNTETVRINDDVISPISSDKLPGSHFVQPTPYTLVESLKRDRDQESPLDENLRESELASAEDATLIEGESSSKRPRLISKEIDQNQHIGNTVDDITVSESQPLKGVAPQASLFELSEQTEARGSDESDFEIPPIYFDSDDDEEENEEGEGRS